MQVWNSSGEEGDFATKIDLQVPIIVTKPGMGGLVPKTSSVILFLGKEATESQKEISG